MKDLSEILGLTMLVAIFSFQVYTHNSNVDGPKFGNEKTVEQLIESANSYIDKSAKEKDLISSDEDEEVECLCDGDGLVHHEDGHSTPCPAIEVGKCKSQTNGDQND